MEHLLIYPVKKGYLDKDLISEVGKAAEQAGFYAFLSWDHYMLPDGPETLDAWSILGYLAGQTDTIKLGTVVTPIPFRPPAQLAKIVASVDHLSGGRTILGVGAGWHQPEFDGFSNWGTPGQRVTRTSEALELITRLWTGEKVSFEGKAYNSDGAIISPVPTQKPFPPMWFGVRGPRMLDLAARYADAWIPTNISPELYEDGLKKLREKRSELGINTSLKGALQNFDVYTESEPCVATINSYAAAGCEYYGSIWSYPPDEMVSRIEWFSKEVMPNV
ncbi:MAG: LLM class flavin-dependent oxidoreductase [SAR202 cluster bacterium]|nr:MAG: LLM class flavin-dependent oxidoreductase [SAR202 cluster bacterium]KAA1302532.1 MAG: LLM class flavin-dependent oxidoreductase [SAR202 cluster bacterium]